MARRWQAGAEIVEGGVDFRVWAPERASVAVVIGGQATPLVREESGYWRGLVANAGAGTRYAFLLDGDTGPFPDPASRFQPEGPHAASEVIDPGYAWTDAEWRGIDRRGQVFYELHIGTFTPEGTWRTAATRLNYLARTGITAIEVMPVSEFPGAFGWGYDGVHHYAPTRLYGRPEDFRAFVDAAHAAGIGVILDVVYNHLGPDGNYLGQFSPRYFSSRHHTDWGEAINFDGDDCGPVRDFFTGNAASWIAEYHLDGFRFDATMAIFDDSADHILGAVARAARKAAGERSIFLVAENEWSDAKLVRPPEQGGCGLDALWNDDFHRTAMVALNGRMHGYFAAYRGAPQEFVSGAKYGALYQGQWHTRDGEPRGTPMWGEPAETFVNYLQNHDQVSNDIRAQRPNVGADPALYRALTAVALLGPGTPLLFQGQEFGATTPFHFFADHNAELTPLVEAGRARFMSQFGAVAGSEVRALLANPGARETFERSKLDWTERQRNAAAYAMTVDLLKLRRERPAFRGADGAVLGGRAFALRFLGEHGNDWLLVVNLGVTLLLSPGPEPLLAPPENKAWELAWLSEDPKYGGTGAPPLDASRMWWVQGRTAYLFTTRECRAE